MKTDPPSAAPEAVYAVIELVRPLFRHLLKAVEDHLEGTGLTVPKRAILERLLREGPRTVPQIAQSLVIQRQFTQVTVNELIAVGLVEPRHNAAHRRSPLIVLTRKGEEAIRSVLERERQVTAVVAGSLAPEDVETCRAVLARLTRYFEGVAQGGPAEETRP